MVKIKIYELAKELSMESKDLIRKLEKRGYEVKSHMSTIDSDVADTLRKSLVSQGMSKQGKDNSGDDENFVARVKRIPKAQIQEENSNDNTHQINSPIVVDKVEAPIKEAPIKATTMQEAQPAVIQAAAKEEHHQKATPIPKEEHQVEITSEKVEVKSVVTEKIENKQEHQTEIKNETPVVKVENTAATEVKKTETDGSVPAGSGAATAAPSTGQGGYQGNRPSGQGGYQGNRPSGQGGYQGNRPSGQGGYQGNRPTGQGGYQGNRPSGQGGYQGNRPAGQGGYQGNRPTGQGGCQGNRPTGDGATTAAPSTGQGGYQGNRPAGQGGGYQGNRPAGQGGYQGNRPAGQGGYQGNRPAGQGGGYQGNRPAGQGGGYQGNRPAGQGGYQGNRPAGQGGYQGNKPAGQGGYQGNKPAGQGGYQGSRPPQKDAAPKYTPTPIEKPTINHRPEKNKKVFVKDLIFENTKENSRFNNKNSKFMRNKGRNKKAAKVEMPPVTPKKVTIGDTVIVGELAKSMGKTAADLMKKLFDLGVMVTINQEIDAETAILIGEEFGVTVEIQADKAAEILEDIEDDEKLLVERPPVVTVMGHVDHGKTSLLDAIKKTNVIATEAGGITQHIGAYQVEINGKKITFLDTPGHEAFTAMRARGAQVTDISIIVVAADDGVMPQTIEAINHSKAAGVPIIIAINKIDKEAAQPDKVKQELTEYGLLCEDWGGDTIMVPVSAKGNLGIDNLLEMILLVSEVAELKANPKRQARGTVIEAQLDKNRGPVATLLVQKGTLRVGDTILAGPVFGKIKAMNDDKGRKVKAAGPSMPVEVLGFSEVPAAGEVFIAVKDDKDARIVAQKQQAKKREEELRKSSRVSLEDLFKQIEEGEIKELNIIIKADVQGSIEALRQSLTNLNTAEVKVNLIHSGAGGITETDIMLASASNAIIIGFNVRPDSNARKAAETENVDIRLYRVIYDAIEDIKKAMAGLLSPDLKESVIGHAEVRQIFKVPKIGLIAGSYILDGKVTRAAKVRIVRDSIVVMEGAISSLRRGKDDSKEIQAGYECGIGIENYNDVKEGDIIEAYIVEEILREL